MKKQDGNLWEKLTDNIKWDIIYIVTHMRYCSKRRCCTIEKRSDKEVLNFSKIKNCRTLKKVLAVIVLLIAVCQGNPGVSAFTPKPQIAPSMMAIKPFNSLLKVTNKELKTLKVASVQTVQEFAKEQEAKKEQGWIDIHGYEYQLSEEEKALLKMVVYAESGGSTIEEQMATTETILNRVATKGKSLTEVVFEKGQFACARNGKIYTGMGDSLKLMTLDRVPEKTAQAVEQTLYAKSYITEAMLTAKAIQQGKDPEVYAKGGAEYFYEESGCSEKERAARANILVYVKIGQHFYYKVWDE